MLLVCIFSYAAFGASDDVLKRWSKETEYKASDTLARVQVGATYYAAEYVEALVQKEAEQNLWTEDEAENYRYELLKTLKFSEFIPILIKIDNRGPSMHMAPFGDQLVLWVGKKKVKPVDYDKRFNFKLQGQREGLVYFPRYDAKTGKELLKGVKTVKLSIKGGISDVIDDSTNSVDFLWDVYRDDPSKLLAGPGADKLEIDRLIKRIEKLTGEKSTLEAQLAEVQAELDKINQRIEELQKQ
jgi:hypothetical protein